MYALLSASPHVLQSPRCGRQRPGSAARRQLQGAHAREADDEREQGGQEEKGRRRIPGKEQKQQRGIGKQRIDHGEKMGIAVALHFVKKVVKKLSKVAKKLSKNCQKLPKSCQKVVKSCQKIAKSCQKKLSKSCQKSCQKNGKIEKEFSIFL
jgi:gamma-glutamylcysteine synthetase